MSSPPIKPGRKRKREAEKHPHTDKTHKRARGNTARASPESDTTSNKNATTTTKTTFLTLPTELRQKILRNIYTDEDIAKNIRMTVDNTARCCLKSVYMPEMKPDGAAKWVETLSAVHPVVAQDVEWVEQAWKKRGDALAEEQTRSDGEEDELDREPGGIVTNKNTWERYFRQERLEHGVVLTQYEKRIEKWRAHRVEDGLRRKPQSWRLIEKLFRDIGQWA